MWWLLLGKESQSGGQSHGGERRQVCPSPPGSDDSEYTYLHFFSNSYAIQQGSGWGWVGGEGWVGEVPECHPLLCVYLGDDTLPHVKQKRKKLDVDMLAYHFPRGLL